MDRTGARPARGLAGPLQHRSDRTNRPRLIHENPQAHRASPCHHPINRLYGTTEKFQLIGFHRGLGGDYHLCARLEKLAALLKRIREYRHLEAAGGIAELRKGKSVAARRFPLLSPGDNAGHLDQCRTAFGLRCHLVQCLDVLPPQHSHVVVKRMPREVKAHGLEFLGQSFGGQPIVNGRKARLG